MKLLTLVVIFTSDSFEDDLCEHFTIDDEALNDLEKTLSNFNYFLEGNTRTTKKLSIEEFSIILNSFEYSIDSDLNVEIVKTFVREINNRSNLSLLGKI